MDDLTPAAFESELDAALASGELPLEAQTGFSAARQRLADNPSLRKGDSVGAFTYADEYLECALYVHRLMNSPELLALSREGRQLKSGPAEYVQWLGVYWEAWRHRRDESLIPLAARQPKTDISWNREKVRIAVVGDAGFKGQAQDKVLQMIRSRHTHDRDSAFDGVIHLGDVYLAGSSGEMQDFFLKPFSVFKQDPAVPVFTLVGNHDLYYGGDSYMEALETLQQPGRFFLIDTPAWRIICLDTSYADKTIGRLNGRLDPDQVAWLQNAINGAGGRRIVVMSHHFYVSAWGKPGDQLREQLEYLFKDTVFAWYWGHEHGCATYDRGANGFYGACVGNGSFREKWEPPSIRGPGSPSWYADGRCQCFGKSNHWPHGFLELELHASKIAENQFRATYIHETYHLEDGTETKYKRTLRVD